MTSDPDAVQYPKMGVKGNAPNRKLELYFGRLPNFFLVTFSSLSIEMDISFNIGI